MAFFSAGTMFCSQCGTAAAPGALTCSSCGRPVAPLPPDPVAEWRAATIAEMGRAEDVEGALWNPAAAAAWSLLFTPIFGAWLHMLNWRALGEPARAAASWRWVQAGFAMVGVCVLLGLALPESKGAESVARSIGMGLLVAWYIGAARVQSAYVREKFGKAYVHRPWGRVLLLAFGAMFGFFAVVLVLVVALRLGR